MIIAIEFDDCIVELKPDFTDVFTPLVFRPSALTGLRALRDAGHQLILFSERSNRGRLTDWQLSPRIHHDAEATFDTAMWSAEVALYNARVQEMHTFVEQNLAGIFAYVDAGLQGKVLADMYIDPKAWPRADVDWAELILTLGEVHDG